MEKNFLFSLSVSGSAHFFSLPPRPACLLPLSSRLRPKHQHGPAARVRGPPLRRSSWQADPTLPRHCHVGPDGQNRLLPWVRAGHDPCAPNRARSSRAIPFPPVFSPLYTAPMPRNFLSQPEHQPPRQNSPKFAAEIRITANPPLQRLRASVSSLPSFGSVVRSRRGLLSALCCSVHSPNTCRTSFQGRRPPLAVASSRQTSSVPISASGEFAPSF